MPRKGKKTANGIEHGNNTVVDAEMRSEVIQLEKEECRVG